jgi:hypothetical protein
MASWTFMTIPLQGHYRTKTAQIIAGLACTACAASAQIAPPKTLDFNGHSWFSYSGDHPVSGPWGLHFDTQWRRSDLGATWQQYQIRPGLNYQPSESLLVTLGYVYTRTYPYGDNPVRAAFPEHRMYQQALIRHSKESVRFQHRIRLEQRFVEYPSPQPVTWTYQNRFRYLVKADLPLKRRADGSVEWYIPVYDEIVIGIPPNYGARPFDQNRVFAGFGRSVGGLNVEFGYLNQFLGQRNGRVFESNHTMFFTATSSLPLTKLWSGD